MKCKSGYKLEDNRCIKRNRGGNNNNGGVSQPSRFVTYLIYIFLFYIGFIAVVNIYDYETLAPLIITFIFLVGSAILYRSKEHQDDLIGIRLRNVPLSVLYGAIFAGAFILITYFIPFFSLAYPNYPASVSSSLRFTLVNIISPVSESVFFIGAIFAFFTNFVSKDGLSTREKYTFIFLVSILFGFFHLGSYIIGVANLSLSQTTTAFFANFSAFFTAFVFNFTVMTVGLWNGVDKADQTFFITAHGGINISNWTFSIVQFVGILPLVIIS